MLAQEHHKSFSTPEDSEEAAVGTPPEERDLASKPLQTPKYSTLRATCLILTCFSAMVINTLSSTSISIALPAIGQDLNIAQDRLQWVLSSYAVSSGCFLLLCGRLADIHGRKLIFLLGTAWNAILALACGFVHTEVQMDILRGLQGIGSAATIPAGLGILAHAFPPSRQRSIAFATFSAGAPFGGGVGLILGGVVTQLAPATWRGVFFMTTGLGALSFIAGVLSVDTDEPSTEPDKRVDWVGAALVTAGLVLITFVLGQGELAPDGWGTPYIIALLIAGVFLVICFLLFEHYLVTRTTRPPLMRLDLWTRANGKFAAMQGVAFLQWCAFMTWMLWAQIYFQSYKNYTPIRTMVRLLPTTVTGLCLNFFVGIVIGWIDVVWLLVSGTMATGAGCLLFALIDPAASYWAFGFPAAILTVFGADFTFACGTLFVARVALPHEQSLAGGVFQTVTQLGTALGLATSTIAHNKVVRRDMARAGIAPENPRGPAPAVPPAAALHGVQAAQWTGFGFAMAALFLAAVCLRGVGVVGHNRVRPPAAPEAPKAKAADDHYSLKGDEGMVTRSEYVP